VPRIAILTTDLDSAQQDWLNKTLAFYKIEPFDIFDVLRYRPQDKLTEEHLVVLAFGQRANLIFKQTSSSAVLSREFPAISKLKGDDKIARAEAAKLFKEVQEKLPAILSVAPAKQKPLEHVLSVEAVSKVCRLEAPEKGQTVVAKVGNTIVEVGEEQRLPESIFLTPTDLISIGELIKLFPGCKISVLSTRSKN